MANAACIKPAAFLSARVMGNAYQYLTLAAGNRHGLVAAATVTGKTAMLQVLGAGFRLRGSSPPIFAWLVSASKTEAQFQPMQMVDLDAMLNYDRTFRTRLCHIPFMRKT
jgi:hypothetical protein